MRAIVPSFHLTSPFKRYCRTLAVSREPPYSPEVASWSHCLTNRATEADAKLQTRLANHRELSHIAQVGALNGP